MKQLLKPFPLAVVATAGVGVWAYIVLNARKSQKASTPIVKSLIYHLRHEPEAAKLLGDDIHIKPRSPFHGHVNHFKGVADIKFKIQGSHADGEVVYKGKRRDKDVWVSQLFEVSVGSDSLQLHL